MTTDFDGKTCDIVEGPMKGKVFVCEGEAQTVLELPDFFTNPKTMKVPAAVLYLAHKPPKEGCVLYGKIGILGYCQHESWLKLKHSRP